MSSGIGTSTPALTGDSCGLPYLDGHPYRCRYGRIDRIGLRKIHCMSSIPNEYKTPLGLTSDIRQLVIEKSSVTLGTINPDGSPHMTLLLFSLDNDDRMHLPTPRTTRKVKNILERPTVTALVTIDGGWASCTGQARIVDGEDAADLNRSVRERLFTETGLATMGRFLAAHEDTTIEITPTKWLSWTMDPIFSWFEDNGINLDDFEGAWMKDLALNDE